MGWHLYLTMRHAATAVQSLKVVTSGSEKCWQGLKEKKVSVPADTSSAGTGLKRSRKPSASPTAFKLITPLPSFMMHLQLLTLKQPGSSSELGTGEGDEEDMAEQSHSGKNRAARGPIVAAEDGLR